MSRRILIVDDEAPARERLRRLLGDMNDISVLDLCANGLEAVERCQQQDFDTVLLDIRMPGMDGIEAAGVLQSIESPPAIIFTTAFDQYAIDAFETEAVGYLLKPVRRERLESALAKADRLSPGQLANMAGPARSDKRYICVRRQDELKLIAISHVSYCEADQKSTRVFHRHGDDWADDSLTALAEEFPRQLLRIHRKFLVAVDQIDALAKDTSGATVVRLRGSNATLPVSRRHLADLRRFLKGEEKGC